MLSARRVYVKKCSIRFHCLSYCRVSFLRCFNICFKRELTLCLGSMFFVLEHFDPRGLL